MSRMHQVGPLDMIPVGIEVVMDDDMVRLEREKKKKEVKLR